MTTTTRTDAHSPAHLVTEDYEYLFAADTRGPWALGLGRGFLAELTNYDPATANRGSARCHHCGAHLRYVAWLRHLPTGYTVVVGETCLDNRFSLATADFHRIRKAAELDRQAHRIRNLVAEFVAANPDLAFMADKDHEHTNSFVADVARKLRAYGELSERQVEAVRRSIVRDAERDVERAVEPTAPVIEGRGEVSGRVLSTKWQDSDFGSTLKMLVQDDRGFKVWGSVPSSIEVERGDVVRFTATVERSQDDEAFGFFKRPTKAVVVSPVAA